MELTCRETTVPRSAHNQRLRADWSACWRVVWFSSVPRISTMELGSAARHSQRAGSAQLGSGNVCCARRSVARARRSLIVAAQGGKVLADPVKNECVAFAPATVANLGPGFDWMGCAVEVSDWMGRRVCSAAAIMMDAPSGPKAATLQHALDQNSRGCGGAINAGWRRHCGCTRAARSAGSGGD